MQSRLTIDGVAIAEISELPDWTAYFDECPAEIREYLRSGEVRNFRLVDNDKVMREFSASVMNITETSEGTRVDFKYAECPTESLR